MPHALTADDLQTLITALTRPFSVSVGATAEVLGRTLPGSAVCAILRDQGDGVTRIVVDLEKPNAMAHTAAMLREWWESVAEPVAFPDGSVELINRPCPLAGAGGVELAVSG